MGVEAGGHEHPGGREPLDRRCHHLVDRRERGVTGGAGRKREVDRRPRRRRAAGLGGAAGAGIERRLMRRHVEHARVVPEDVLGAVAVVHVPIEDQHPFAPFGERGAGDRDVVQQAEALAALPGRVVAGRAHRDEGRVGVAPIERVDRDEPAAGGERGGVERAGGHGRVGVEVTAARRREAFDRLEVAGVVDACERLVIGGASRRPGHRVVERGVGDALHHRVDPRRPLRMAAAGVVVVTVTE